MSRSNGSLRWPGRDPRAARNWKRLYEAQVVQPGPEIAG